jgi:hypothetical protein
MSTERAAYEIPRAWEHGQIDCAVVFWALPTYYWLPEIPTRDFAYYHPNERAEKIEGARGIRDGTDFDDKAMAGLNRKMKDLVAANMYYQDFHHKQALIWRHENALLRLETQARARHIPIVHYYHPATPVPTWLDITSGPVDLGSVGSMQDQLPYSANFMNCENRLNRRGNIEMARIVKRDSTVAVRNWYDQSEKSRIQNYRSIRERAHRESGKLAKKIDYDLHETVKARHKRAHNKGAGARPDRTNPELSNKELKRRAKAAKRQ